MKAESAPLPRPAGEPVLRIDERLLHAQVLIGWVQALGLERIVVACGRAAADPETRETYRLIMPDGVELELADERAAARLVAALPGDRSRTMVLTESPAAALAYLQAGGRGGQTAVHVGGLYHRTGRTKYRDGLYLDDGEATALRAIEALGLTVDYRPIPCVRPVPLRELLARG